MTLSTTTRLTGRVRRRNESGRESRVGVAIPSVRWHGDARDNQRYDRHRPLVDKGYLIFP